ncbi:MAG: sulfur metabolite repression control [Lasallia pustulata]|uniref:Sulfur metabolite repression control n=1 Tax=Lasallia pustulata TaxID=136370 RepID=A0A5M8PQD8_9LECA|nr:MAG: sulfur metabolite repression control [Lasallia pustulata]
MASHRTSQVTQLAVTEDYAESFPKRKRPSLLQQAPSSIDIPPGINAFPDQSKAAVGMDRANTDETPEEETNISISATSKMAGQTVAPFLAKHIPDQYAPLGGLAEPNSPANKNPNTKYCYRHRPDLKCRRQVNEPSMDQLQHELEVLSQADQQAIAHVWSLFSAAPSKLRNLMLQGILTQCCFPQLSYLSAKVLDLIRIDFLTALPPEISFRILCYLDTTSLCKAAQVSQRWRELADDDVVWHRMCEQHIDRKCTKCGWGLPLLERKRLRASKRQIQLRATGRGLNEWSPDITPFPEASIEAQNYDADPSEGVFPASLFNGNGKRQIPASNALPTPGEPITKKQCLLSKTSEWEDSYFKPRFRPWKDVYKDRFKVGTNWKYGRCSTKIFKGHSNGVMCLQFDDNILATGSYDATIKIWDIETGKELRTLKGHDSGIRCLQFDDTKLISGSMDRSLKIWNWRTGECISTYTGHSGGVIGLHFDSSILASGSVDKTIKIWNFEDKSTFLLRGHTDWVNAVKVDSASRTVFSASDDCTVRLWDLDSRSCLKVFEGHVGQVQQVLPLPSEFDFEDDTPNYDDDDGASIHSSSSPEQSVILVHSSLPQSQPSAFGAGYATTPGRPNPPRYMLTGALDSTIRLWDVSTGKCLRTFFGHVEGVWALAADTLRVVSGAEDRMVKVWDTRSGKCERTFTGHAGPVTCIGLSDSRMCTGSEDCDVRVYSFKNEEISKGMDGHEDGD